MGLLGLPSPIPSLAPRLHEFLDAFDIPRNLFVDALGIPFGVPSVGLRGRFS